MIAVDEQGEPTGGLNEGARLLIRPGVIADMMGLQAPAEELMPRVAERLASAGITSIQDPWTFPRGLELYDWLEKSGAMSFRVRTALFQYAADSREPDALGQIAGHVKAFQEMRARYSGNPHMQVNAVKLFVDAVLEGNPRAEPPTLPVAAVLGGFQQPIFAVNAATDALEITAYVDTASEVCVAYRAEPAAWSDAQRIAIFRQKNGFLPAQCEQRSGELEHSEAFVREYVRQMTEAGFHVHLHALSDRAVRVAADAFEAVKQQAEAKGLTQSVAHVQLAHPDDQRRLGRLGVYAVFTYLWILPNREYDMMVLPFIDEIEGSNDLYNPDHYYMRNVYPVKSMVDAGVIPVFGSDAPVGSRDPMPFASMAAALTREAEGVVMNAAQRIDIDQVLASYTINGARLMGAESELGSLEPGKIADLIVLDRNLVELAQGGHADAIAQTRVLQTWFEGKLVYERKP